MVDAGSDSIERAATWAPANGKGSPNERGWTPAANADDPRRGTREPSSRMSSLTLRLVLEASQVTSHGIRTTICASVAHLVVREHKRPFLQQCTRGEP